METRLRGARGASILSGPPPALPPALDRLAERWTAAPARVRLTAGVLAVLAALAVAGRGATASRWGPEVTVLTAARDLPPGRVLTVDDVTVAAWPAALRPAQAPSEPAEVVGRTLSVGAPAGTLLTGGHVGDGGIAAGLGSGRAAFPLAVPDGVNLDPGQRVDVVAGDPGGGGLLLAAGATVVSVDGGVAWLSVARGEAPALAGAASWGDLTVVLLPPGP